MDYLVSFFGAFWAACKGILTWMLSGIGFLFQSVFYLILDGFLTVIYAIVAALDFGTVIASYAGYWSGLPPQLIYAINACGIPSGISILVWAMGIRMLLNLIPAAFTRV